MDLEFEKILIDWERLCSTNKKPELRRARALLLKLYEPLKRDLKSYGDKIHVQPFSAELRNKLYFFRLRWDLDIVEHKDSWEIIAIEPDAVQWLSSSLIKPMRIDPMLDGEPICRVDLTRSNKDIVAAITKLRKMWRTEAKDQGLKEFQKGPTPQVWDALLLHLHTNGSGPTKIAAELNKKYANRSGKANFDRSDVPNRLKTLRAFLDPRDLGNQWWSQKKKD